MKYGRTIFALLSVAFLTGSARADSLTYTQLLVDTAVAGQGATSGRPSVYGASGQYTYGMGWFLGAQFDSSLGHLDSMDWSVTFSAGLPSHFTYLQPPASVGPGSANESWSAQFIRIGSLGLDGRYLWATTGLPSASESLSVPVGGSVNGSLLSQGNVSSHLTDPGLLNDFIQGTSFFVDTASRYNFDSQYANGGAGMSDFAVQLSYTYNFTPVIVPEPSSVVLLMLSSAALWWFRRRAPSGSLRPADARD